MKPSSHAFLLLLLANTGSAAASDLRWLAGKWCGTNHGVFNEEVWMLPRANSLIGMHRDTVNGKLVGFEYFRIVEDATGLVYLTQPNGKPPVAFRASELSGKSEIIFTNQEHDFPKRIHYRRIDSNTLWARIDDGTDQGRSMEWSWTSACNEAPSAPEQEQIPKPAKDQG